MPFVTIRPPRNRAATGDQENDYPYDVPPEEDKVEKSDSKLTAFFTSHAGGALVATLAPSVQKWGHANPRAAMALKGGAAIATLGYTVVNHSHDIIKFIFNHGMASVSVPGEDIDLCDAIRDWTLKNAAFKRTSSVLALSDTFARNYRGLKTSRRQKVVFEGRSPMQFFRVRGRWFVMEENEKNTTLWTFGYDPKPIKDLINEIQMNSSEVRDITVYNADVKKNSPYSDPFPHWKKCTSAPPRNLDSVCLDHDVKRELIEDIGAYLDDDAAEDYAARGLNYRRGYLLHGKPGCGKTSFAMAVAGHFALSIYTLSLTDPNLTDAFLLKLFQALQPGTLCLLEDIDCAGLTHDRGKKGRKAKGTDSSTEDSDSSDDESSTDEEDSAESSPKRSRHRSKPKKKSSSVTLSGLLNALDGASAPTGHLVFMSTNHIEKLDPALIRPGRVDVRVEFKYATKEQIRDMFLKIYAPRGAKKPVKYDTSVVPALAEEFAEIVPGDTFAPAMIQQYLLKHMVRPVVAVERAGAWVKEELANMNKAASGSPNTRSPKAWLKALPAKLKLRASSSKTTSPTAGSPASETSDTDSWHSAASSPLTHSPVTNSPIVYTPGAQSFSLGSPLSSSPATVSSPGRPATAPSPSRPATAPSPSRPATASPPSSDLSDPAPEHSEDESLVVKAGEYFA
ncbi:hypothetical protein H2200_012406 [Cladophialophora chaetospira]|uniref:AAA+ ATPase domain-containing protein n=1 Tax=Cladophialophora chaetospira TaxID=386627 RepID=A0AA39CCF0_9EURO|nr:hypothetical protein H2200_012406 [Cladophialophora chaetospira]